MTNLERLHYNEKAMRIYQVELKNSTEKKDSFEIYLNLGNLLHWIIMTEEWHKKHNNAGNKYENNKTKQNMEGLMKGVRFANNSMKHNMMFRKLHIDPNPVRCGSARAVCGTFYAMSDEVLWNQVEDFKTSKPWEEEQHKCYNEHLRIKSVTDTLDVVVGFLINETAGYLNQCRELT